MTREEAIYRLKNMAWLYGSAEREQNIEAIDMAIEALQREEAEEKGYCHRIKPKEYLKNDAIQGEWVGFSECSVCGKQAYDFIEGCVEGVEYLPNYCPNCGAKMFSSAKLNNPCNSLLTDESNGSKEHKSKLDLISRADAVKTVIRKCSPICDWQVGTQQYPDCVVAEINALPSAEADVVRCKDCRHWKTDSHCDGYRSAEDFCSWGERREP